MKNQLIMTMMLKTVDMLDLKIAVLNLKAFTQLEAFVVFSILAQLGLNLGTVQRLAVKTCYGDVFAGVTLLPVKNSTC